MKVPLQGNGEEEKNQSSTDEQGLLLGLWVTGRNQENKTILVLARASGTKRRTRDQNKHNTNSCHLSSDK
jgi:hypothetical protein